MDRRLELQALLAAIPGVTKAYFQPPANVQMEFPAVVYEWDRLDTQFAGNNPYRFTRRYQVTVIDRDPDSVIPNSVATLPMCVMNRHFTVENLHHTVFNLYF